MTSESSDISSETRTGGGIGGYVAIARIDHWFKNVFVLPGVVAALGLDPSLLGPDVVWRLALGLVSICLVASSNYVINEVLDAPRDRHHPIKKNRPVPSGQVKVPVAIAEWLLLGFVGVGLGWLLSPGFFAAVAALWVMGLIYNVPPVRSKDLPYVDVISEAINNPLRLIAGWYVLEHTAIPPASLLLSYWMIGCYFMAMKRYAEYREIGDPTRAAAYRNSFSFYSEERLLVSVMFYGSAAMLFFGAFIMRYRLELIVSFPLVALIMALYLDLAFRENSPVQSPENLYRQPVLMSALVACVLVMGVTFFVDIPALHDIFSPTAPTIFDRHQ